MAWDVNVFHWINQWPDSLSPIFIFFSEGNKWLWVRLTLLAIALLIALRLKDGPRIVILLFISVAASNETTDVLKAVFQMKRPCVELTDVVLRVKQLTSFGTASAHSANMAAVAGLFWMFFRAQKGLEEPEKSPTNNRKLVSITWPIAWTAIAFFTGLSRIYVGVHYPSQVLLGWTVGILASVFTVWISNAILRSVQHAKESRKVH